MKGRRKNGGKPAAAGQQPLLALLRREHNLRVRPLQRLISARGRCCWALEGGERLRVAGWLDLDPSLVVHLPPPHGVIGLIYALPVDDGPFVERARDAVQQAVHLRQLLLEAADAGGQRALQVELVLLVPEQASQSAQAALAETFDHIARSTGYLRLVGLNVATLPAQPDFDQSMRRAFAWLLRDTRAWFAPERRRRPRPQPLAWRLTMEHYRLPETRAFGFAGGVTRLHLVHGHNGSGKSTLVEGLELLLTESIGRLVGVPADELYQVLRNREATGPSPDVTPASLCLARGADGQGDALGSARVDKHGIRFDRGGLGAKLPPYAFRLDQNLMNELLRADAERRAELLLEAFAPDGNQPLARLREARGSFEQSFAALPEHLRLQADTATSSDESLRLAWVHQQLAPFVAESDDDSSRGPADWSRLLPLTTVEWAALAAVRQRLRELLAQLATAPGSVARSLLTRFDGELEALRRESAALQTDLATALRVMREFAHWQAAGRIQRGANREADLQRWLELRALVDLAGRHADVLQTLARAAALGWVADPANAQALPPMPVDASVAERARRRHAELHQELTDARERLRAWSAGPDAAATSASGTGLPSGRRYRLLASEQAALTQVGRWLPSTLSPTPLGEQFSLGLANNQQVTLGEAVLGRPGGLDKPIEQGEILTRALERVQQLGPEAWPGAELLLGRIKAVVDAAQRLSAARQALSDDFFVQLAPRGGRAAGAKLQAAVNELLALTTPARWAYADLALSGKLENGRASLGFAHEGVRAELMLNTAELNAFVLMLFVLLAPQVNNPLRLMVLDDPLQNMDEMMVCTLARALAALLPQLPPGWSVLALFHGMEDVERIREEAPAALYRLPWTRVRARRGILQTIEHEPNESTHDREAQPMASLDIQVWSGN